MVDMLKCVREAINSPLVPLNHRYRCPHGCVSQKLSKIEDRISRRCCISPQTAGADPKTANVRGETALSCATANGHLEISRMLRAHASAAGNGAPGAEKTPVGWEFGKEPHRV